MDVKNAIKKVESDAVFQNWRAENPEPYLASVLFLLTEKEITDVVVTYYDKKTDKILSFSPGKIKSIKEEDVLKAGDDVKGLIIDEVEVLLNEALEVAEKASKEHYSKLLSDKIVAILQHLDEGQVWNITFVTTDFQTINVRVDAKTNALVSHDLVSLFKFSK